MTICQYVSLRARELMMDSYVSRVFQIGDILQVQLPFHLAPLSPSVFPLRGFLRPVCPRFMLLQIVRCLVVGCDKLMLLANTGDPQLHHDIRR